MSHALYIAAKAPRPGLAKTRLARTVGEEAALGLYRAFVADLAARFADAPFPVNWYITPGDAWEDLRPLVGPAYDRATVLPQGDGDWAHRQDALFRTALSRGEERCVLVASDSPHLTVETVSAAFHELTHHNLVFGPVHDGGYYLIGMRGWHDVLGSLRMSTSSVLGELLQRARLLGLTVSLLDPLFDVDDEADLASLAKVVEERSDLPHTSDALRHLRSSEGSSLPARPGPSASTQPDSCGV